jgi:DNA repair exonuclease SbcCD ATPase subunit
MKINALNLRNFRSHEATDLTFDRLNFILGPNHSGKSSICFAVEYLLTGRCPVTDERGSGADDLIRKGQSAAEVVADITVGTDQGTDVAESFQMARIKTLGGSTLELRRPKQTIAGRQAQEWLAKRLPSLPVLSACLNSGRFLEMPAQNQKNLLSSVLADEGIPVPPELRWDDNVERVTIAELDQAHKRAYERRTEVNRKLKEFEQLTPPEDLPGDLPTVQDIQSRLRERRTERDGLLMQRSTRIAAHEGLGQKRDRIQRQLATLVPRILAMAEEKRLKTLADRVDEKAGEKANAARSDVRQKREQIAKFEKLSNIAACPTCAKTITKKEIADVVATLKGELKDLEAKLQTSEQAERDLAKALQYRQQINESIAAVGEKEALEDELSQLPEVAAPDTSDLDSSISELDQRIAKGEGLLLTVNERRRKVDEYANQVVVRARYEEELRQLEAILQFAGPDGARKQATQGKMGAFLDGLNRSLNRFGYQCVIALEPYQIRFTDGDGAWLPREVNQLSESERFRFAVAFQIALAEVTGTNLILIDRADVLDRESRRQLTAMLMATECQAIVASTSTDPLPAEVPEGVRFFSLAQRDDGTTGIAEQVGHAENAAVSA